MDSFEFNCDLTDVGLSAQDIVKFLPPWKTRILEVSKAEEDASQLMMRFLIAATNVEEIKLWIKSYESHTFCTYYIRDTPACKGNHITFKQILNCHHNARNLSSVDESKRKFTHKRKRNTNCPSYMKIKLYSLKKRKRYRPSTVIHDPEMPCEVELQALHNHEVEDVKALSWRRVSEDIKDKIYGLYERGHNASTARDLLKMNVCFNFHDYETMLADRKFCPNYNYCAYLYLKYKRNCKPLEVPSSDEEVTMLVVKYLEEFNDATNEDSARFFSYDGNVIICICPPLFRRIHDNIKIDIVFLDSVQWRKNKSDNNQTIYFLYTNGVSCLLPLGIIITNSPTMQNILNGFEVLKEMLGDNIFGESVDGPRWFVTNDSVPEVTAVSVAFKNSEVLLCVHDVLETVYLWLGKPKNAVPKEEQLRLFRMFRKLVFAGTKEECEEEYEKVATYAERFPSFASFLLGYWERKELWALCFRDHEVTNSVKAALREQVFQRIRDMGIIQVLDFFINKYMPNVEKKILEISNKSYVDFLKKGTIPSPCVDPATRVQKLGDKLYLVPKEDNGEVYYIVNLDNYSCSCMETVTPCRHVNWLMSQDYCIDDSEIQKLLHYIATGAELQPDPVTDPASPKKLPKLSEAVSWIKVKQLDGTTKDVPIYEHSKKTITLEPTEPIETPPIAPSLPEQIQNNWNKIVSPKNDTEIDKFKDEGKKYLQESTNHLMNLGLRAVARNPEKSLDVLKQLRFIIEKYKNVSTLLHALKTDQLNKRRTLMRTAKHIKRKRIRHKK